MKPVFTKGNAPFIRLLVPLITGIMLAIVFPCSISCFRLLLITGYVLPVALLFTVIFYRRMRVYQRNWVPGILLYFFIVVFSYADTLHASGKLAPDFFTCKKLGVLVLLITSEPFSQGNTTRFEARVTGGFNRGTFMRASGNLMLTVTNDDRVKLRFSYGDKLLVPALYTKVPPPANPAQFDYRQVLSYRSVYDQAYFKTGQVMRISTGQGNPVIAFALRLRLRMMQKYAFYIHDKDAAALASALLLGYRATLDQEIVSAYSKTGTTHVLSVSGMHVGIVFIVLLFLLKFMDRSLVLKIIRAFLIIGLVIFYAILTGLSSAVCRAAVMLIFIVLGRAVNRNIHPFNLLSLSAFVLLIYNPFFIADAGFQLSYLAMLGLFYLYPIIYESRSFKRVAVDKLWSGIAVSIAAQVATFPVSLYYFHQFPVYFLISNLFILLPVTVIMYVGIVFLFVPWHSLLNVMGMVLEKTISFMDQGLFYIGNLPYASIGNLWITKLDSIVLYGLIFSVIFLVVYKKKQGAGGILACLLVLLIQQVMKRMDQCFVKQVVVYSIRKHTAIGFIDGSRGTVLSDLETTSAAYLLNVQPYLSFSGINSPRLVHTGAIVKAPGFYCRPNFIQFLNYRIVVWDKFFAHKTYRTKFAADLLIISNNPSVKIGQLMQAVNFKYLVIDGSNSDYHINNWCREANEQGIKYYLVKNRPACIVNL